MTPFIPQVTAAATQASSAASVPGSLAAALPACLAELEASLKGSQKALLIGDAQGLEESTRQQVRLARELQGMLEGCARGASEKPVGHPESAQASSTAAHRILHLGRVHLALIRRAEQYLQARCNLAAGAARIYGPRDLPGRSGSKQEGRHLCRA